MKGPSRSRHPTDAASTTPGATLLGYTQDALFLTSHSKDLPFVGRAPSTITVNGTQVATNGTIESQVAEVVWFMQPSVNSQNQATVPATFTLYRRFFLVRPDIGPINSTGRLHSMIHTTFRLTLTAADRWWPTRWPTCAIEKIDMATTSPRLLDSVDIIGSVSDLAINALEKMWF